MNHYRHDKRPEHYETVNIRKDQYAKDCERLAALEVANVRGYAAYEAQGKKLLEDEAKVKALQEKYDSLLLELLDEPC